MIRFIKQVLIAICVFGLIFFFISLLLPSSVQVSKSVLINAPGDSVKAILLRMEDWKKWSSFLQDSTLRYTIISSSEASWIAADGTLNSIKLKNNSSDSISAIIQANDKIVFNSGFSVKASDNNTVSKVEWWMLEELKWYPWEKFYGLFSESFKETYVENSLEMFKRYVENKVQSPVRQPQ